MKAQVAKDLSKEKERRIKKSPVESLDWIFKEIRKTANDPEQMNRSWSMNTSVLEEEQKEILIELGYDVTVMPVDCNGYTLTIIKW